MRRYLHMFVYLGSNEGQVISQCCVDHKYEGVERLFASIFNGDCHLSIKQVTPQTVNVIAFAATHSYTHAL